MRKRDLDVPNVLNFQEFLSREEKPVRGYNRGMASLADRYSRGAEEGKQEELLRVAEKRTLEMIADGASLTDVLNYLCAAIDDHASATSFVCLLDGEGNQLLPSARASRL